MFKIEDASTKNGGNPQRNGGNPQKSKCIKFNTLNGYFYAKISRGTPIGERAVQLSRQTRSPMKQSPCPAGLGNFMALWSGKAHKHPQHRYCGARRFGAAVNRSRVTAQRAVEDYILRLI